MPMGMNGTGWEDPLGGINLPANGSNPLDPVGGRGSSNGSGIGCGFIFPIILALGIIGFIILIVLVIWLLI